MPAGTLFDHRDGAAHLPASFEIAQQHHRIGEVGDVDGGAHVAHQAVLRHRDECGSTLAIQILQQLVHVKDQGILFRHRGLIAVETVDENCLYPVLVDLPSGTVGEFTGREFGRIDLLDQEVAALPRTLEIDIQSFHSIEQKVQFFVENENGCPFAARDRRHGKGDGDERFAGAGGP